MNDEFGSEYAAVLLRDGELIAAAEEERFTLAKHARGELPRGAIVGTSSLRRASQLRALRPDLVIRDCRGNVQTRLAKLDDNAIHITESPISRERP